MSVVRDFFLQGLDLLVGTVLKLIYFIKPLLDKLQPLQLLVYELPAPLKVLLAFCVLLVLTAFARVYRRIKLGVATSTTKKIVMLQTELRQQEGVHSNYVMFQSISNLHMSRILLLGFLYVAGPNLQKYLDGVEAFVFAQLRDWFPIDLVESARLFLRVYFIPALYFVLVYVLSRSCKQLWQFNKRHRDFDAYQDAMVGAIDKLKARLNVPSAAYRAEPVRADRHGPSLPSLALPSLALPSLGTLRRGMPTPVPPPPRTEPGVTYVVPQLAWRRGRIARIDTDRSGIIQRVSTTDQTDTGLSYWFDLGRFITSTAVKVNDHVMFLEHDSVKDSSGAPAAVLIAPLDGTAFGHLRRRLTPEGVGYFAVIRDSYGNSAEIPLLMSPLQTADVERRQSGARIVFVLGASATGLQARNSSLAPASPQLAAAAVDY